MATLDALVNFGGKEGEDALGWYKSFLNAAGPLGERGMLNQFPLFMEPDSRAEIWCDELPEETLSSWTAVDRQFRRTWLRRAEGKAEDKDKFRNHILTDDAIFAATSNDVVAMSKVVVDWVEKHAQLGKDAKLPDAELIEATLSHLPAFIRAFLRYKSNPHTTFRSLCSKIKEITDPILELEQLRRQEASVDWQAKIEKKLDHLLGRQETSDDWQGRLEKKLDDLSEISKNFQTDISNLSSLKEAESEKETSDSMAVISGAEETAAFSTPREWKNTKVLLSKDGMIEIVKRVMRTLRNSNPSDIDINAAYMLNIGLLRYYDAIKMPNQFHFSSVNGQAGTKSTLWQAVYELSYQRAFRGLDDVTEFAKTWESIFDSTGSIRGECIYRSNHTSFRFDPDNKPIDARIDHANTKYYGGLAQLGDGSASPRAGISSFKTALCLLLSVYLAEDAATEDKSYEQAAIDSANWIIRWSYDERYHLARIFIWDICNVKAWKAPFLSPVVTGLFIEGLCVLASVTGEQKWRDLAIIICDAAMAYQNWHDDEGVFKYVSPSGDSAEENIFRGLLIRGLLVAYQRNPANEELRHKIRSYINVQFNGIQEYNCYRGSYGMIWNGPYARPSIHADMALLDPFMAAVVVNYS